MHAIDLTIDFMLRRARGQFEMLQNTKLLNAALQPKEGFVVSILGGDCCRRYRDLRS